MIRLDDARLQAAQSIFREVVDLPAGQRSSILSDRCHADLELRSWIEELLVLDADASSLVANTLRAAPAFESPTRTDIPAQVGRFELIREIAHGGVGVVYEARQSQPNRTVALKLLRGIASTAEVLRRFELEAEALGQLNHPGIAHVYEAGVDERPAPSGGVARTPYVAMELIDGRPLTAFADEHRLSTADRLDLLAHVADAVQHAHQNGIIHRDLKPANVLVASDGQPKLVDFGVARFLAASPPPHETHAGQILGTPAYMSPEQTTGKPGDVDARSDIYALGVIGYELLAGRLPHNVAGPSLADILLAIRGLDPPRLGAIKRELRGDIECIIDKALQKQKESRYASAAEFAADLRRSLRHDPITARPPSFLYQLSRFARRRRGLVIAAGLVLLSLIGGVVGTTVSLRQALVARDAERAAKQEAVQKTDIAQRETERAAREERLARTVNTFLNDDLLAQANPFSEPNRDIRLREVVDRAAARIADRFTDDPLAEMAIRQTLGVTYRALDELTLSSEHLAAALAIARRDLGPDNRKTIRLQLELGYTHRLANQLDDADRLWNDAAARAEAALGPDDRDTLEARSDLAVLALGRDQPERAEEIGRAVLAKRRATLGDDHGSTLVSMSLLGSALERLGKFDETEALYREYLDRSRRALGNEHPDTMIAISNLGLFYSRLDRFAEAEPLTLEVLELRRRVLGPEHDLTVAAINNVGYFYSVQKRYAETEPFYTQALEIRRRRLGNEHPDTLLSLNNLGWLYTQMQRWDEAETLLVELVALSRKTQVDSLDLDLSLQSLGGFYVKRGRLVEAEPLLRETLQGFEKHMPPGDWRRGAALSTLGDCLRRATRFDEAEQSLLEAYELVHKALGPAHQQTRKVAENLATLYRDQNRPADAARWSEAANSER